MIIVAHRGGPRVYSENSAAAINASFEIGADIVEIDIRLSVDKVPVVIHDDNLRRLFSIDQLATLGIDWVLVNDVQLGAKTLKHP